MHQLINLGRTSIIDTRVKRITTTIVVGVGGSGGVVKHYLCNVN